MGALQQKIVEREGRLTQIREQMTQLDQERIEVTAEIRAYRDAAKIVEAEAVLSGRGALFADTEVRRDNARAAPAQPTRRQAKRGLSPTWEAIWRESARLFASRLTIDNIAEIAAPIDSKIRRDNVRSQAWTREKEGDLRRMKPGIFEFTPQGLARFGLRQAAQ